MWILLHAGLRFGFIETGRSYWVSSVLERSAANFAGVLEGDRLLQIDDRVVSVKDDILRYFLVFFSLCFQFAAGGGVRLDLAHFSHDESRAKAIFFAFEPA
jgi:hypothetical protein